MKIDVGKCPQGGPDVTGTSEGSTASGLPTEAKGGRDPPPSGRGIPLMPSGVEKWRTVGRRQLNLHLPRPRGRTRVGGRLWGASDNRMSTLGEVRGGHVTEPDDNAGLKSGRISTRTKWSGWPQGTSQGPPRQYMTRQTTRDGAISATRVTHRGTQWPREQSLLRKE